jgi:hypothetical protein
LPRLELKDEVILRTEDPEHIEADVPANQGADNDLAGGIEARQQVHVAHDLSQCSHSRPLLDLDHPRLVLAIGYHVNPFGGDGFPHPAHFIGPRDPDIPPVRRFNPSVPARLEEMILRCVKKDALARPS